MHHNSTVASGGPSISEPIRTPAGACGSLRRRINGSDEPTRCIGTLWKLGPVESSTHSIHAAIRGTLTDGGGAAVEGTTVYVLTKIDETSPLRTRRR